MLPKPAPLPHAQDRAGSAHVAVLSVAPWQEYVGALQPAFPMDEQKALAEAIPNTLDVERRLLDVLAVNARAALPGTTTRRVSTRSTTSSGTDGERARTEEAAADSASRVTQSGNPADVKPGELSDPKDPPRPARSPLDSAVAIDPFVRYSAATSLFQEVRLLQRYVRDVVIGPDRDAYVMRLQVTLMPSRRDLPVDAYTTLSFFGGRRSGGESVRSLRLQDGGLDTTFTSSLGSVRVVPIMVSDNLEGAAEAASTAVRRQVSLGLLASLAGAGLGADGGRTTERLEGILGRQINSLLTVGQVSNNTLRVRFGAMNQPRTGLGLVPRNQTVTVLVVVPKARDTTRAIRVASRTDFVNGWNGEPLRSQSRHDLYDRVDHALKQYDVHVTEADTAVAQMLTAVQEGNLTDFATALAKLGQKCGRFSSRCPTRKQQKENAALYAEAIWMDVGSILATHPYSVVTATLPRAADAPRPDSSQRPLAVDDGTRLVVIVEGDPNLSSGELWASMPITAAGATLASTSVEPDKVGRLVVSFPSPTGSGYCSTAPKAGAQRCAFTSLRLCRVLSRWNAGESACASVPIAYVLPKAYPAPAAAKLGVRVQGAGVASERLRSRDARSGRR